MKLDQKLKISVIYSGHQLDYLYGLVSGFRNQNRAQVNIIDAERFGFDITALSNPEVTILPYVNKTLGRGKWSLFKVWGKYYFRLLKYLIQDRSDVYHIEWINKKNAFFEQFFMVAFMKLLRKKIVFKVHDLDSGNLLNRKQKYSNQLSFSRRFFFNRVSYFIVHNQYVKNVLIDLGYDESLIEVIPHGINNYQKPKGVSRACARDYLGIPNGAHVLLFYGNIRPYKGLDVLIALFQEMALNNDNLYLVIAGALDSDSFYQKKINSALEVLECRDRVITKFGFIDESLTEFYFKASDLLCLPYKFIYQSGLPFLSYSMGLPVLARHVGGIPEDIESGRTGWCFNDNSEFKKIVEKYFSNLTNCLSGIELIEYTNKKYSWDAIISRTIDIYEKVINK